MAMKMAYTNGYINKDEMGLFINEVKNRLVNTYAHRPSSISIHIINACLLYFKIDSEELPSVQECAKCLENNDVYVQKEYAHYLSLMGKRVKEVEGDIYKKLLSFYEDIFYDFKDKLISKSEDRTILHKVFSEYSMQFSLLQALGECQSKKEDVHLFLFFLVSSPDESMQTLAKEALAKCKDKALSTFEKFLLKDNYLEDS